jgi:hypothetical protein
MGLLCKIVQDLIEYFAIDCMAAGLHLFRNQFVFEEVSVYP